MLYPCMLCVALLICLFVLCVACLTVFGETIRNVFRPYPEAVQGDKPTLVTHADLHPACG